MIESKIFQVNYPLTTALIKTNNTKVAIQGAVILLHVCMLKPSITASGLNTYQEFCDCSMNGHAAVFQFDLTCRSSKKHKIWSQGRPDQ